MKRVITVAKRAILLFQMRAIEIQIDGMNECMDAVRDPVVQFKITAARVNARKELARIRKEYNATLPAGERRTWRLA